MSDDGKIDYAEVMRRLPHRYPFLLVDKAEDFVANTSITGIKNVTHNEPFFPGHFPIDPVMPGVMIVEAMAQTGALLMSKSSEVHNPSIGCDPQKNMAPVGAPVHTRITSCRFRLSLSPRALPSSPLYMCSLWSMNRTIQSPLFLHSAIAVVRCL